MGARESGRQHLGSICISVGAMSCGWARNTQLEDEHSLPELSSCCESPDMSPSFTRTWHSPHNISMHKLYRFLIVLQLMVLFWLFWQAKSFLIYTNIIRLKHPDHSILNLAPPTAVPVTQNLRFCFYSTTLFSRWRRKSVIISLDRRTQKLCLLLFPICGFSLGICWQFLAASINNIVVIHILL